MQVPQEILGGFFAQFFLSSSENRPFRRKLKILFPLFDKQKWSFLVAAIDAKRRLLVHRSCFFFSTVTMQILILS